MIKQGPMNDKRREQKREIEADRRFESHLRSRAAVHRQKAGPALPVGYQRGSMAYFAAYRGFPLTIDELQQMRDSMRPKVENAEV